MIGVLALIAGLVSGVFLSQGLAMLTAKMFAVQMKEFKFVFSQMAFIQTILYFAIIFIIVMIFNGITISKYKLINLLNSAKKNQPSGRVKNHFQYLKFRKIQFLVSWKKWRIIQNWQREEIIFHLLMN